MQKVQQLAIDDDQDCLWMQVKVAGSGASCHVGYRSCFYRRIPTGINAIAQRATNSVNIYRNGENI